MVMSIRRMGAISHVTIAAAALTYVLVGVAVAARANAQSYDFVSNNAESALEQEGATTEAQPQQNMPANDKTVDEDFAPNVGEEPPATDLETGLPLRVFLTPIHWGSKLSLLSFSASEGYNSNPSFERAPLGSWITALSGVALYSTRFAGWRANVQYQPFVWISSTRTLSSFAAASGDLRTLHHINDSWHWTLADRIRYSPSHGSQEQGLSLGGFSIGNAFLSTGRNIFVNGVSATLTDRYSQDSTLTFHANQDYTRLSSFIGSGTANVPTESATTVAAGLTWHDRLDVRDTLSAEYTFRHQTSTGTSVFDVNSHAVGVGWSHKFSESLGISATVGPAFTSYAGQNGTSNSGGAERATIHGSFAVTKEFRRGGIIASFERSDGFTGVISDSFHNRFDLSVHQQLTTRLHFSAVASYVQQQVSNAPSTNGELAGVEARYFLSPNWALFSQARYISIGGNERNFAPEKNVIVGVRWAWVPDKE